MVFFLKTNKHARVVKHYYCGTLCKVSIEFTHHLKKELLPVHINIYRQHDEYLWCPSHRIKKNPYNKKSLSYYYFGIFKKLSILYRSTTRFLFNFDSSTGWPLKNVLELKLWIIPKHFIDEIVFHGINSLRVPLKNKEYLEFRYGDWRNPTVKWSY